MFKPSAIKLLPFLTGLAAALSGALTAVWLSMPIPWLLGPLLATAACSLRGLSVPAPALGRKVGLAIIGVSLGLYFTPQMSGLLLAHWPLFLFGMAFALTLGLIGSLLLYRYGGVDFTTAWYAAAVGGASEMANMADKAGADSAKVVSAHSLRVLMIATIIPFFYQYMGYQNTDSGSLLQRGEVHWGGLLLLLIWAYLFARLFEWRNWSNPWTFGPLLAALVLTVSDIHLSAMPAVVSQAGQLLIGWSLGNRLTPGFFRAAPRWLGMVAANVGFSLLLTALTVWILAQITSVPLPTLGLGLSPGSVAEMTITAKVLHLGVPLVTAFHVSRMIVVVGTAGILCRWIGRRMGNGKKAA